MNLVIHSQNLKSFLGYKKETQLVPCAQLCGQPILQMLVLNRTNILMPGQVDA